MADRKGVMIYFDVCKSIDKLNDDQAGRLFKAIMLYASTGALPDFDNDIALDVAWGFMQDKIDRDAESYAERCRKNRENQLRRWDMERAKEDTDVYERIATATTTATTTATPTANATANAAAAATTTAEGEQTGDYQQITPDEFNKRRYEQIAALRGSTAAPR